jgi:hypothetical protein
MLRIFLSLLLFIPFYRVVYGAEELGRESRSKDSFSSQEEPQNHVRLTEHEAQQDPSDSEQKRNFVASLHAGPVFSYGSTDLTTSAGGSFGVSFGYHFHPQFVLEGFYQGLLSISGFYFHVTDVVGLDGRYLFSSNSKFNFYLGGRGGRMFISSVGHAAFIVPLGSGSFQTWTFGPKFGFQKDIGIGKRWFIGGEFAPLYVLGGSTTSSTLIGVQDVSIPNFIIFDANFVFGIHF